MNDMREQFEAFKQKMMTFRLPRTNQLPGVELYMDQVLTVLTEYLSPLEIEPREDFITSAMINNYVKQGLIIPPRNKKYTKTQVCYLIVICTLKKVYSIGEIKTLLDACSRNKSHEELRDAYHKFCECIEAALHCELVSSVDWKEELEAPFGNALALSVAMKIYEEKIVALKRALLEPDPPSEEEKK